MVVGEPGLGIVGAVVGETQVPSHCDRELVIPVHIHDIGQLKVLAGSGISNGSPVDSEQRQSSIMLAGPDSR